MCTPKSHIKPGNMPLSHEVSWELYCIKLLYLHGFVFECRWKRDRFEMDIHYYVNYLKAKYLSFLKIATCSTQEYDFALIKTSYGS